MMEENNDIFLAGDDALVYLAGPMHTKNIPQRLFGTIHLVRTYLMTNFSNPLPLARVLHIQSKPPFVILFYLRNSRINVFVSYTHFLASHLVSYSLPRKAFSLMLASNYQSFYLS